MKKFPGDLVLQAETSPRSGASNLPAPSEADATSTRTKKYWGGGAAGRAGAVKV